MIEYTLTKEGGAHQYLISVSTIGDENFMNSRCLKTHNIILFFLSLLSMDEFLDLIV